MRQLAVFSFAVLLSAPVLSQDIDCSRTMVQMELNQCAYMDWEAADAGLNTAYGAAMAVLEQRDLLLPAGSDSGAALLREAQRAWITFRDNACAAEGFAMKGGSAEPLLVYGCMRQLTIERTGHLTAMVASYEG